MDGEGLLEVIVVFADANLKLTAFLIKRPGCDLKVFVGNLRVG